MAKVGQAAGCSFLRATARRRPAADKTASKGFGCRVSFGGKGTRKAFATQASARRHFSHSLGISDVAQGAQQGLLAAGFLCFLQRCSEVFINKSRVFAQQFNHCIIVGAGGFNGSFLLCQSCQ